MSPHTGYRSLALLYDVTFETAAYSQLGARDGQLGLLSLLFLAGLGGAFLARRGQASVSGLIGILAFALSLCLLSWYQNSARYLIVAFPFLFMGLYQFIAAARGIWGILGGAALMASHAVLLPNFGYGFMNVASAFKANHAQTVAIYRPVRQVADELSTTLGRDGRVLFIGDNGGFQGRVFETGWYDAQTSRAIGTAIAKPAENIPQFLKDRQLDAIVINSKGFRFLRKYGGPDLFTVLDNTADRIEVVNNVSVYYLRRELSLPTVEILTPGVVPKTGVLKSWTGQGQVGIDVQYSCVAPVTLRFLGREANTPGIILQDVPMICDGETHEVQTRFDGPLGGDVSNDIITLTAITNAAAVLNISRLELRSR